MTSSDLSPKALADIEQAIREGVTKAMAGHKAAQIAEALAPTKPVHEMTEPEFRSWRNKLLTATTEFPAAR